MDFTHSFNMFPVQNLERRKKLVTYIAGKSKDEDSIRSMISSYDLKNGSATGRFGQDAYFIAESNEFTVYGIADGVTGWLKHGIDSGKFSSLLMKRSLAIAENAIYSGNMCSITPQMLINRAYHQLIQYEPTAYGGSTVCCVVINKVLSTLTYCNLGDSGFVLYDLNDSMYCSKTRVHPCKAPYQLVNLPCGDWGIMPDQPYDSLTDSLSLSVGNVIIAGTDGLWDNFDAYKTLHSTYFVNHGFKNTYEVNTLASSVFGDVNCASRSNKPLKSELPLIGIRNYGSKNDDITIIISGFLEE